MPGVRSRAGPFSEESGDAGRILTHLGLPARAPPRAAARAFDRFRNSPERRALPRSVLDLQVHVTGSHPRRALVGGRLGAEQGGQAVIARRLGRPAQARDKPPGVTRPRDRVYAFLDDHHVQFVASQAGRDPDHATRVITVAPHVGRWRRPVGRPHAPGGGTPPWEECRTERGEPYVVSFCVVSHGVP